MYENNRNEITGNHYDSNTAKKVKQSSNYEAYQSYDDGGFQTGRTVGVNDVGPNVVVNLNATGNGVNTILRYQKKEE